MKIEELTSKIYEEGVAKAKQQESELLEQARKEADRIVAEARESASGIVEKARKEAEQSKARLLSEMKLAGDQAIAELETRITDTLVRNTLPKSVESALDDHEFLQQIIREVVSRWDTSNMNIDIAVVLPPATQESMTKYFASQAKELLDRGLELKFSEELTSGFQIRPKDGSYRVSFQKADFVSFFRQFLRDRTREILFPATETTEGETGEQAGPAR